MTGLNPFFDLQDLSEHQSLAYNRLNNSVRQQRLSRLSSHDAGLVPPKLLEVDTHQLPVVLFFRPGSLTSFPKQTASCLSRALGSRGPEYPASLICTPIMDCSQFLSGRCPALIIQIPAIKCCDHANEKRPFPLIAPLRRPISKPSNRETKANELAESKRHGNNIRNMQSRYSW